MKKLNKIFVTFLLCLVISMVTIPVSVNASAKLNQKSLTLNVKKNYTLKVTGTKEKITWTSSNKKVATVSKKGKVRAVKKGTATITAKYGKKKLACKVTVKQPVTSVQLNKSSVVLTTGKSITLKATVLPKNANNKTVSWTSSNKKVATVSSTGVVTTVGTGTAVITAKAKDGSQKKASCKITVKQGISSIELNRTSVNIIKGKAITLVADIKPNGIDNKEIIWVSSNPKIATVSSAGVVNGVATGTATITVKDKNNGKMKASCKVTVLAPTPDNIYQTLADEIKYIDRFDPYSKINGQYSFGSNGTWDMQISYIENEIGNLRKSIQFTIINNEDVWGKTSDLGMAYITIYPNSNECLMEIVTDGTIYETTTTRLQIQRNKVYDFRERYGGPDPDSLKLSKILQTALDMWDKYIPSKTYNGGEITIGMKDLFPNF